MYEFKRSGKIEDEVKIGDEMLNICISIDDIAQNFSTRQKELVEAEQYFVELKKQGIEQANLDAAYQFYGNSIISLLKLFFGDEGTEKLVKFYENKYTEIAAEVIPYIAQTFLPKIQESLQKQKDKIKRQYVPKSGKFRAGK